jgi:hypothetical protein
VSELLASSVGSLELLAVCGGVPELLVPWTVTLMSRRNLTVGVSPPHQLGCYYMP